MFLPFSHQNGMLWRITELRHPNEGLVVLLALPGNIHLPCYRLVGQAALSDFLPVQKNLHHVASLPTQQIIQMQLGPLQICKMDQASNGHQNLGHARMMLPFTAVVVLGGCLTEREGIKSAFCPRLAIFTRTFHLHAVICLQTLQIAHLKLLAVNVDLVTPREVQAFQPEPRIARQVLRRATTRMKLNTTRTEENLFKLHEHSRKWYHEFNQGTKAQQPLHLRKGITGHLLRNVWEHPLGEVPTPSHKVVAHQGQGSSLVLLVYFQSWWVINK